MMEKTEKKTGFVLIGLGVIALTAFAAYRFLNKNKTEEIDDDFEEIEPEKPKSTAVATSVVPTRPYRTSFPLTKGSSGALVSTLQSALIKKYGPSILPRYGADGFWGSEMEAALISKGLPVYLNQVQFQSIIDAANAPAKESTDTKSDTSQSTASRFDPLKMSDIFHYAIREHNFDKIKQLLAMMKSVADYKSINRFFKARDMYDGTRRTLVNGLLFKFKSEYGKKILSSNFFRMGLKFDGRQWSLSGITKTLFNQIKTRTAAKVWNASKQTISVPKDTILGKFIGAQNDITKFQTLDGKLLYTNTINVQYV